MSCLCCREGKSQAKHKKKPVLGEGAPARISHEKSDTLKESAAYLRTAMASSMVLASTEPSSSALLLMFSSKGTSR